MMWEQMRVVVAVVACGAVSGEVAVAQQMVPVADCCDICRRQECGHALTAVVAPPIVQQQIVYRDIQRQAWRQQAYLENVPVTRLRKMTVDQGSYQTVWVPKMVVQNVPETRYESRVRYRTVAVPVTQRVAELRPGTAVCPPPLGTSMTALGRPAAQNITSGVVLQSPQPWSADTTANVRVMPTITIPASNSTRFARTRVPTPDDWTTIGPRTGAGASATTPRLGGYRTVPQTTRRHRSTRRPPRSVDASTASKVWRVQRSVH